MTPLLKENKRIMIKNYLTDFLAGVLILILVFLSMKFITLDLRFIIILGAILLVCYGYYISKKEGMQVLSIVLVSMPISIGFILGILPEIPSLWTAIPMFIFASFLGFQLSKKYVSIPGILILISYAFFIVPQSVESDLSQFVHEKTPNIILQNLESSDSLVFPNELGKVTVLDFYGTWCKPCIEEMSELNKIRKKYTSIDEVEFVLVCTEYSKDTPEKARIFISERNLNGFIYAFDEQNKAHKTMNFTGVPALVIIDKQGIIKFKHEGYNASEDLNKTLSGVIDNLLLEQPKDQ